jgi:atypical dual specificity phosphatase
MRTAIKKKSWPWWSTINDTLVLGAIPLKNKGHIDILQYEENVGAVLTLLEPFEWESKGPMSSPVQPEDWLQRKVIHHHIHAKDFVALNMEQIQRGVNFIHNQVQKGNRVYVHCKAGRGRSATVVACYLLKYCGFFSVDEVLSYMKSRRPQIAINPLQKDAIESYFKQYCS